MMVIPIVCNIYAMIMNVFIESFFLLASMVIPISVGNGVMISIPATIGIIYLYGGQNVLLRKFLNVTMYGSSLSMVSS